MTYNPMSLFDDKIYPTYDNSLHNIDIYDDDEMNVLQNYLIDEIGTCAALAAATILDLGERNGESRALRFVDYHMHAKIPYVRICGMASGSQREERVKRDSNAGKRNFQINNTLMRIKACNELGIRYIPPTGIRKSIATRLAANGANTFQIQRTLGHTTPTMSARYVQNYANSQPVPARRHLNPSGPKM
ncbi:MAG: tyrosine-type recombinase/integrase [Lachnospiraceae bacterium]|nr:tyrosine-type recombinase/integrase [Candidatus Colinaster equi]